MLGPEEAKREIAGEAARLGFASCGVAPASVPPVERERLRRWLAEGMHGTMAYMARGEAVRADPARFLPGARSLVAVALNYFTPPVRRAGEGRISIYALGRDYHKVAGALLRRLESRIALLLPAVRTRRFVDAAPLLEKCLAERAGIGWRGKHANVILGKRGSWFFLGGIVLDRELPPDEPAVNRCGSCAACLDACPTGAIVRPYVVDARRCISYLTIERRGVAPANLAAPSGDWIFGCDLCQEACPWNRSAAPTEVADLRPREGPARLTLEEARSLGRERFERLFEGSAVRRAGWDRFRESVERAIENRRTREST